MKHLFIIIALLASALPAFAQCDPSGTVITFANTGNNTAAGFVTKYILTTNSGVIIQEVTSPFTVPVLAASYKVYSINYDGATGTAPTLTAGTNIAAIGGTCVETNTNPLLFSVCPINILGNVLHDIGGLLTDATVNGTGTNVTNLLYANLISGGVVVASTPIAADGTYSFANVTPNTNYTVIVATSATATAPNLPTGWVNTGETIGTTAGNDGTVNGAIAVSVATSNIININFGIEQTPSAATLTQTVQLNPGSTVQAPVAATTFGGADPDGTVTGLQFTSFPTNATSVVVNGTTYNANNPSEVAALLALVVPTNAAGEPTQTITIDPTVGAVTVQMPYVTVDNAGFVGTAGVANVPFNMPVFIALSGTVYNDANGLTNSLVDGIGTNANGTLYANLINGGVVVASIAVANDGTYSFPSVTANTTYTVVLTTSAVAISAALPLGYTNTGEGRAAAGDGTVDGSTTVSVATSSVTGVNFGIQQTCEPPATSVTFSNAGNNTAAGYVTTYVVTNASGVIIQTVTSPFALPNAGGDYRMYAINYDGATGTAPTTTNGTNITAIGGTCVALGSPMLFTVCAIGIAGNVLHDVGGLLSDATVNGTGTNVTNLLYANLVSGGVVVASTPIAADGSYSFANVTANTNYTVIVATSATATVPNLPTGWVNTGENIGTTAGNDGAVNGAITVGVATSDIVNINFGIEQTPSAATITQATQPNPNGSVQATVDATTFGGADLDGTVTGLRFTAFPTNAASVVVNGVTYNANVPAEVAALLALVVPTNTAGEPTQTITIDPTNGAVTVIILYITIDNAGLAGTAGVANVPFSGLTTVGSVGNFVWADTNGNGAQDMGEAGINTITVELWKETAPSSGIYVFDQTTTTITNAGNDGYYNFVITTSGNYYVKFPITSPTSKPLVTQTATAATDGNSDALPATGYSPVFYIDVNGTGMAKDNNTIDAGYGCPNGCIPMTITKVK